MSEGIQQWLRLRMGQSRKATFEDDQQAKLVARSETRRAMRDASSLRVEQQTAAEREAREPPAAPEWWQAERMWDALRGEYDKEGQLDKQIKRRFADPKEGPQTLESYVFDLCNNQRDVYAGIMATGDIEAALGKILRQPEMLTPKLAHQILTNGRASAMAALVKADYQIPEEAPAADPAEQAGPAMNPAEDGAPEAQGPGGTHGAIHNYRHVAKNVHRRTYLHFAAWSGDAGVVAYLLQQAPELAAEKDANGNTPLHFACLSFGGYYKSRCVQLLLASEFTNLHEVDNEGRTALHFASRGGCKQVLLQLFNAGANELQIDGRGRLPLHCATKEHMRTVDAVFYKKLGKRRYDRMVARSCAMRAWKDFEKSLERYCPVCHRHVLKCRENELKRYPYWLMTHNKVPR